MIAPAEVTLPDDRTVRVVRGFRAPAALVFRAYTDPALLPKWLSGHDDWQMTRCDIDLRVGGSFRWEWTQVSGIGWFGFFGDYLEIDAPRRIRNTETFDPGTFGGDMGKPATTTVQFDEAEGVTTMTTTIAYPDAESCTMSLQTGMTDGMEVSYQKLDALIASGIGT